MQFEDLDKKIKELTEQRSPAYDKQSWQKMEKLLDNHLPQEKNKRRGLFISLFFLLLGGGAAFLLFENYSSDQKRETAEQTISTESIKKKESTDKTQPQNNIEVNNDVRIHKVHLRYSPLHDPYVIVVIVRFRVMGQQVWNDKKTCHKEESHCVFHPTPPSKSVVFEVHQKMRHVGHAITSVQFRPISCFMRSLRERCFMRHTKPLVQVSFERQRLARPGFRELE